MAETKKRDLVLGLCSLAAFTGLVALYLSSKSTKEVEVDDAVLAKAKAEYERNQARSSYAPSPVATPAFEPPSSSKVVVAPKSDSPSRPIPPALKERGRPSQNTSPRISAVLDEKTAKRSDKRLMDEANSLYDRQNFDEAQNVAESILSRDPDNVRMLRIMVSSACIMGNEEQAKSFYPRLPAKDQRQMAVRCERYGVTF